jgi:hypothetical protein
MAAAEDDTLEPFIRAHVHSAEELEALVLLFCSAGAWWSPEAVAQVLHLEREKARRVLEALCGAFLDVRLETEVLFRFATLNAERERLTARLAEAYHRDRTGLMQIVSAPGTTRQLADALRVKKEEP